MMLIPDWRQAWRMFSVRVAALAVAWSALPVETQAAVLGAIGVDAARVPGILGLLIIAVRLIDQPALGADR